MAGCRTQKMKLLNTSTLLSINVFCALKCPRFCAIINGNSVEYRPYGWKQPMQSTIQTPHQLRVRRRTPFCMRQRGEIQACRNALTRCLLNISLEAFEKCFTGFGPWTWSFSGWSLKWVPIKLMYKDTHVHTGLLHGQAQALPDCIVNYSDQYSNSKLLFSILARPLSFILHQSV